MKHLLLIKSNSALCTNSWYKTMTSWECNCKNHPIDEHDVLGARVEWPVEPWISGMEARTRIVVCLGTLSVLHKPKYPPPPFAVLGHDTRGKLCCSAG